MPSPAISRKRNRAHLEQDELVTEPEESTRPLASIKKRKLNTHGLSTAIGFSSLPRRTIDTLETGKNEKENIDIDVGEEPDELVEKDVYGFPDGDDAITESRRTRTPHSAAATPKTTPIATQKGSGKPIYKKTSDRPKQSVFDVPEDEPPTTRKRSVRKLGDNPKNARNVISPLRDKPPEIVIHRGPGRPRKDKILKEDKKLSNKARRESLRVPGGPYSDEDKEEEEALISPKKRKVRAKKEVGSIPNIAPEATLITTVKKRGRPRKILDASIESTSSTPRSILTPSKHRVSGLRKSVAFEKGEDESGEVDLGFKDIPKVSHNKRVQVERESSVVEEPDSEDDDDTACAICSGLDSKKRNPILLCDGPGCEFAVHKDCYQVAKVPKGDWFCKACQPDTNDVVIFPRLNQDIVLDRNIDTLPKIEGFEVHLERMRQTLLPKLTGQKRIRIRGHEEEMQKVYQVVEQTVLAGEGNSMLVIGARGCGKTTLVESIISDLSIEHRENFHVVRLNGFIHTDDKLALKETWRQLGREMEVEDDLVSKTTNAADTLASLLALLSHPSEISESHPDQIAKSVIFILDEFDLFTTHPRQTLLYNLFDIAQARKAPIVVLGLTTRIDVAESLEKRVKSRFSHRYVYLSLPKSLPAFWDICKEALTVNTEELGAEGFDTGLAGQDEFLSYWYSMIEDLYNKDPIFKRHLQSYFYQNKSVTSFFTSCIQPILNLSPNHLPLTGKTFVSNPLLLSAPDSKLQVLQGLSELELALLIASARLDIILDTDTCNFAMAYDEYSSLTSRHKIQTSSTGVTALGSSAKVWGREVALGAWERLANYELLTPAGIGGGGRDTGTAGRMWKVDVGLEEVTGSVEGLSGVMAKWCREI